jgi:threonine dehydrogenase-like Zn-dependent dehydrogenase
MNSDALVRAVHIVGLDRFEVVRTPAPPVGPGMALVAPAFVGLCGTDLELLHGTMPYFAQGHARYPLQPGHEWSGTVLASQDGRFPPGTRTVFDPIVGCGRCERCMSGRPATHCGKRAEMGVRGGMDGALATAVVVPTANLVPVPQDVRLRDAVLVEPMVTVLMGIERVRPQAGDEALVVGAGTLGLLAAMLLSARGLRTHVLLRNPVRVPAVEAAGGVPWPAGTRTAIDVFDVVIEAAGTADGIRAALANAAPGGRVALLGVPSSQVPLDVASIVTGDVSVFGVLNGPGQYGAALEAIATGVVRPHVIVDALFPFEDVAAAFASAQASGRPRPKVLVQVDPAAAAR